MIKQNSRKQTSTQDCNKNVNFNKRENSFAINYPDASRKKTKRQEL